MGGEADRNEALSTIVLSSDALPEENRFGRWREELMDRVLRVHVDVPDRRDFHTDLLALALPRLGVIEHRSTPSLIERDSLLIRDGADDLMFNFAWKGISCWRWGRTEAPLAPGQAIVSALNDVCDCRSPDGGAATAIRIGRAQALRMLPSVEARLTRPFTVPPAAMSILRAYLDALLREPRLAMPTALLAEQQIAELIAHALDPFSDLARAEPSGGVKAARFDAILADIGRRLASPRLNAAAVARRLGISERYLQRLMEERGTSFTEHVREERLKLALRLLRDPRRPDRAIGEIAAEAGFNDISYFDRLFRRRFGTTPREARGHGQAREARVLSAESKSSASASETEVSRLR